MVKDATFRAWMALKWIRNKLIVEMESGLVVHFLIASVRYRSNPLICASSLDSNIKCYLLKRDLWEGFFLVFFELYYTVNRLSTLDEGEKKVKQLHVENQLCHHRYDFVLHCHRSIRDEWLLSRHSALRHATPGRVMPRHVTPVSYEHENDWDYENVNCDNEGVIFRFE